MTKQLRTVAPTTVLARLIDTPDLVRRIHALPPSAFSSLVRHVGLEDAGELVALATSEQLVRTFDEDLFVNTAPGERETFDGARFAVWLEVLLEAGDDVAARKVAGLSEDFVVRAFSSLVMVLDHDALWARMDGGDDALAADKAIESALSEEIEGYLLVSLGYEGWDAVLSLILALDRDHRAFLERILDRCANLTRGYVEDLEALTTALSEAESLAENVEAEREERRSKLGYVEPRAARAFLSVARLPLDGAAADTERDAISRAYFRDLGLRPEESGGAEGTPARLSQALGEMLGLAELPQLTASDDAEPELSLSTALRALGERNPQLFDARMEELSYLTNVLVAGAMNGDHRFRPAEAGQAVLVTVQLGAELEAIERRGAAQLATSSELYDVLRTCTADVLFRKASSALADSQLPMAEDGFLRSCEELEMALEQMRAE